MFLLSMREVEGSSPDGRNIFFSEIRGAMGVGASGLGVSGNYDVKFTKATFTMRNSHFGAIRVRGWP